jgi:hypothetical protein
MLPVLSAVLACVVSLFRSPTWKTFLANHMQDLVALDFIVVPTVKHTVLFVLVICRIAQQALSCPYNGFKEN